MSEDKRITKTKRELKNALLTLLNKKPIRSIKVVEVCALADINRSTYYDYYSDIYSLLEEMEDDLFEEMNVHTSKTLDAYVKKDKAMQIAATKEVVLFLQHNKKRFLTFLKYNEENRFEHHMFTFFSNCILGDDFFSEQITIEKKYNFLYHMSGSFALLREWILDDCPISADELTNLLVQFSSF